MSTDNELSKALAGNMYFEKYDDELFQTMSKLLILLLKKMSEGESEDDSLIEDMKERILNKYPVVKHKVHQLIPSPS